MSGIRETLPAASTLCGEVIEQDEFAKYERIVKAKSGSHPREGFQWWKRAKLANKRADEAEKAILSLVDRAQAYDVCEKVAAQRIAHITPEFEAELPRRCGITREIWEQHKARPILGVDMVEWAKLREKDERIADLMAALRSCQSVLAMMIAPDAIKQTTVVNAFAAATAAEAMARRVLENGPAGLADATPRKTP